MMLRLQADADLNQTMLLAVVRRAPTLDCPTAEAAGLAGLRDPEVLALAAGDGRVLVLIIPIMSVPWRGMPQSLLLNELHMLAEEVCPKVRQG